MIFVAIVNGQVPVVHAFMDENGRRKIVNGDCYLNFLQETRNMLPTIHSCATRSTRFMVDARRCSCTLHHYRQKKFLLNKLGGRVIGRGTQIAWPAHSPDWNPFDFLLGMSAKRNVFCKTNYSGRTYQCCEKIFRRTSRECLALNVLKRANLCVQQNEGHFQHLL